MCCSEFDDVGDEQMARDEQVEDQTKEYVLTAIIVAAYTYENSVLRILSRPHQSKHKSEVSHLYKIFNNQSEIHHNFANS